MDEQTSKILFYIGISVLIIVLYYAFIDNNDMIETMGNVSLNNQTMRPTQMPTAYPRYRPGTYPCVLSDSTDKTNIGRPWYKTSENENICYYPGSASTLSIQKSDIVAPELPPRTRYPCKTAHGHVIGNSEVDWYKIEDSPNANCYGPKGAKCSYTSKLDGLQVGVLNIKTFNNVPSSKISSTSFRNSLKNKCGIDITSATTSESQERSLNR